MSCVDSRPGRKSTVKPVHSDHLWAAKSGRNKEVVSLQRSKSIVQALLGHTHRHTHTCRERERGRKPVSQERGGMDGACEARGQ